MSYEFPLLDLTGNFPVKSVSVSVSGVGESAMGAFEVELMFCHR
jgi:hypothetical protein